MIMKAMYVCIPAKINSNMNANLVITATMIAVDNCKVLRLIIAI
jgi:hypothetical protein